MEDSNWIFERLPNWLRWIIALPVAAIAAVIASFIVTIINLFSGFEANGIYAQLIVQIASFAGFTFALYYCVPRYKGRIAGVVCILFAILCSIVIALLGARGQLFTQDNFINLVTVIVCIALAVYFLSHSDDE